MSSETAEANQSRKPKNTAFRQQRLPAWQPILTAKSVLPIFIVIGVIFIPIGVVLVITSDNIVEVELDYTDCAKYPPDLQGSLCKDVLRTLHEQKMNVPKDACQCNVIFEVTREMTAPVVIYYGLTNFYQNHRRYVKSRDDDQLAGQAKSFSELSDDCLPFKGDANNTAILPCGAISNSMFNDSFTITYSTNSVKVNWTKTNIAWETDKTVKFKNPSDKSYFNKTVKPPNWELKVNDLDDGLDNEDLIVWMRTAALPSFRKLYGRVTQEADFKSSLPKGNYSLVVNYNYPTYLFAGRKRIYITNLSWMGGKNPFLGGAYLLVGSVSIVLFFVFLVVHMKFGTKQEALLGHPRY